MHVLTAESREPPELGRRRISAAELFPECGGVASKDTQTRSRFRVPPSARGISGRLAHLHLHITASPKKS
jgi:hypothetical protein